MGALTEMLRQALDTPGIDLIDVPVDYSEDDHILNQEIAERSAAVE